MGEPLAVVVVTYNSEHVVGALLDSLPAALAGVPARVVVVDNGSTDGTVALLRSRADCEVVVAENRGYSAGINLGTRTAGPAHAVLVLNPDVRMAPGSVPPMLAALAEPGTGIVAPRMLDEDGTVFRSLRRRPTLLRATGLGVTGGAAFSEYVDDPAVYAAPAVADWAVGAALLVSARCAAAVGPWDESFFLYSEETDFCLRAGDLGFCTRYEPAAVVTHVGGGSGRSDATHAMQIVNRVRCYARRHGPVAAWTYFGLVVLGELSWVLRGHRPSRFAVRALLRPAVRPAVLGCSTRLLPR